MSARRTSAAMAWLVLPVLVGLGTLLPASMAAGAQLDDTEGVSVTVHISQLQTASGGGGLALTGDDPRGLAVGGGILLVAGSVVVVGARRRAARRRVD